MAWSTRQLAELAGTTLKTVRHYHEVGLLDEPERAANGYKRYRIGHLVRLLRIRRLVDLGVPLSEIAVMEESEENTEQSLRALDDELAASIERQQRMREELAVILRHRSPADLPAGFDEVAAERSDADRALLLIYSRVFGDSAMAALWEMLSRPPTPVEKEFDALPADASEDTRSRLAERYLSEIRQHYQNHPALLDPWAKARRREETSRESVVVQALLELYNPAQLDVLRRIDALHPKDGTSSGGG
ncbi:DNA-binding transcriptional regulator, MerR family [Actinopolyspora mzabensis]|uniref:DNA-binding transcriptional regulator, MerR family n=1 Tax=Actinopolyspora mzabensis TaxID=995066 RepID=A0A1G9FGD9_ACTMZ|nr:MerR family transcriptional regulator [Actinopolyspora mzabensis]SDK87422.1 DNA-binding transcriptional regulator, MerR family [Actinopolyspora mzabensis]